MDTELLLEIRGNVQTLRHMWSSKVQQFVQPNSSVSSSTTKQRSSKYHRFDPFPKDEIIIQTADAPPTEQAVTSMPESIAVDGDVSLPTPSTPITRGSISKSMEIFKESILKINRARRGKCLVQTPSHNATHHWHVTRHVFRSGFALHQSRRASDSILPLLMKTQQTRPRFDSVDSVSAATPFESLVDYLTYNDAEENDTDTLFVPSRTKRAASDVSDCIRRNQLGDSIVQYETVLSHLKNYDQFLSNCSLLSPSRPADKSLDQQFVADPDDTKDDATARVSRRNSPTDSLSPLLGKTFSDFLINDLLSAPASKSTPNELHDSVLSARPIDKPNPAVETHNSTAGETQRQDSLPMEAAQQVLNELDTMLANKEQENTAPLQVSPSPPMKEAVAEVPPLMERLFAGKKSAFQPDDLNMQLLRLPPEMVPTYEKAKTRFLFKTEQPIYASQMTKIGRRKYTPQPRILCITNERVCNLTQTRSYVKESFTFDEISGITCTPFKDGFVCVHTNNAPSNRGDWLMIVEHPCEFVTQLFMAMGRQNNNDHFLKIESNFKFTHHCYVEADPSDRQIETRISDRFRLKSRDANNVLIIYTS